jgi:hypothetical protein
MNTLDHRALVVELSVHAIQRYRERVRPALGEPQLEAELICVLLHGEISTTPPPWLSQGAQRCDAYLGLGDIVFPLMHAHPDLMVAVTCLCRGAISPDSRHARNQRRQARCRRDLERRDRRHDRTRGPSVRARMHSSFVYLQPDTEGE